MLLVLLTLFQSASASGRLDSPVHQRMADACAVQTGLHDPEKALLYQGYQMGYTSPPGGPVTTHVFVAAPQNLSLHRVHCEEEEPGSFEQTPEVCGPTAVLKWEGRLLPGTTYVIRGDVGDLLQFTTSGEPVARACPVAESSRPPPRP